MVELSFNHCNSFTISNSLEFLKSISNSRFLPTLTLGFPRSLADPLDLPRTAADFYAFSHEYLENVTGCAELKLVKTFEEFAAPKWIGSSRERQKQLPK